MRWSLGDLVATGALVCMGLMAACGGQALSRTPVPSATPTLRLTLVDAQDKAHSFASSDQSVPVLVKSMSVQCNLTGDDRYAPERRAWVIHCQFLVVRLLGGFDQPSVSTLADKTYFVDDITGQVSY